LLSALFGGALIGLAATLFWFANGRVAGISGILRGALLARGRRGELLLFLAGLVTAGCLAAAVGAAPAAASGPPVGVLVVAGGLVGVGTRLARGCTSGHGVCGLSRFSVRSLVAVVAFMATGAATVFVVSRILPGWGVR